MTTSQSQILTSSSFDPSLQVFSGETWQEVGPIFEIVGTVWYEFSCECYMVTTKHSPCIVDLHVELSENVSKNKIQLAPRETGHKYVSTR